MLNEINIESLKEMFKELVEAFNWECDNSLNVNLASDIINIKELKTVIMFQQIIHYLENQKERRKEKC